jgi:SagB-type dehydrogenase family enzyme
MSLSIDNVELSDLYLFYHQNTNLTRQYGRGFDWVPKFDEEDLARRAADVKQYPAREMISLDLKERPNLIDRSFFEILEKRRSTRFYTSEEIKFSIFSWFLHIACGVTGSEYMFGNIEVPLRSVPSAGGLCSSQLWVFPRRIEKLNNVVSFYDSINSSLAITDIEVTNKVLEAFLDAKKCDPAVIVAISSRFDMLIDKYGQRGYRYALLDAGHLGQNIYLAANALDLGVYSSCGFIDQEINDLCGMDGMSESITYVFYLGLKPSPIKVMEDSDCELD